MATIHPKCCLDTHASTPECFHCIVSIHFMGKEKGKVTVKIGYNNSRGLASTNTSQEVQLKITLSSNHPTGAT